MPQYGVVIFAPAPGDVASTPPEELAAHGAFGDKVTELGGELVTGYALVSAETAKSVRGTRVIDGPFTESKEVIAGFFVIEARDDEHALAIAEQNPATWRGGVEVRRLLG